MDITLERIFHLMEHDKNGKIVRGGKAKFARSLGYDSGDIVSMWENGSSKSYLKKLHEIAAKYDVSVEWLKGETDNMGGTGKLREQKSSFWDTFYSMCLGAGKSPNRVAKELGIPSGSVTMWKMGSTPRPETLQKIADYFQVPVGSLIAEITPAEKAGRSVAGAAMLAGVVGAAAAGPVGILPAVIAALDTAGVAILAKKKEKPVLIEDELDAELIKRLVDLSPQEKEKVDAFVQGLLANREGPASQDK